MLTCRAVGSFFRSPHLALTPPCPKKLRGKKAPEVIEFHHSKPIIPSHPQPNPSIPTMLSIRNLARSAPRAAARFSSATLRQSASVARPSTLIKSSAISVLRPARAAFSTTVFRGAAEGETDDELSAKLDSEIQIEEDMKANEQEPASIKDFINNSAFELIDTPGQEVVKLVRSFGDEK